MHASETSGAALSPRRPWLTLAIVGLGVAPGPLDTSVNIAFPAITNAFGIAVPTIQWVVICYVLTYASLLLGCGRLSDIVGHKRVFVWGLCWSAVSLTLCGLAPTFGWFLFFRSLQGIGTALVLSCGPALATLSFAAGKRGRILGLYTMLVACASTLGPLLGGVLVQRWGWPAVFVFRVPIALVAAVLVAVVVRQPVAIKPGQRFDLAGALTLTLSLSGLLLALNRGNHFGWLSPSTLGLGGMACLCLAFFVWWERRYDEPVIDVSLFRYPAFAMANIAHVLIHVANFIIFLLVPYYLLNAYRASVTAGGLLLALSPLGVMLASPLGGWLLSRTTAYRLSVLGSMLVLGGLLGVSQWQADVTRGWITGTLLVQGIGLGLFQVAIMDFVMGTIPRHQQGVAGSLTMVTRTIGVVAGATGGALLFELLRQQYVWQHQAMAVSAAYLESLGFLYAFRGTFWAAAAVAGAACLLMWSSRFAPRSPSR
jgi:EmrB/QacA subfamily drug resistance transporter